jgi:hypothetical protein
LESPAILGYSRESKNVRTFQKVCCDSVDRGLVVHVLHDFQDSVPLIIIKPGPGKHSTTELLSVLTLFSDQTGNAPEKEMEV